MGSMGTGCKVIGLALTSVSSLYALKYLTITGTGLVEYLPTLFDRSSTVTLRDHLSTNNVTLKAAATTAAILATGVIIRKLGSAASSDRNIQRVERFVYGQSAPTSASVTKAQS